MGKVLLREYYELCEGGVCQDLLTEEDNSTFSRTFAVTVNPVNDPPTLDAPEELDFNESVTGYEVSLTGIGPGPGEDQPIEIEVTTDNASFLSDLSIDAIC